MAKNLIAYYSRAGENYFGGSIRSISKGNTERVAEFIREEIGGDLFEIETVEPYPADYYECTDVAKAELNANARPAIVGTVDNADEYDTVFVGYPNWWGTAPMCVFTFLEGLDLAGVRVVPFCTNEGSGMGSSEADLRRACPGATVERGLAVTGNKAAQSRNVVAAWARQFA